MTSHGDGLRDSHIKKKRHLRHSAAEAVELNERERKLSQLF